MYYTFEDLTNKENIIKTFDFDSIKYDYLGYELNSKANDYIQENYESFKDKLDTYNYVFEVHDGNIVLTDFYRD